MIAHHHASPNSNVPFHYANSPATFPARNNTKFQKALVVPATENWWVETILSPTGIVLQIIHCCVFLLSYLISQTSLGHTVLIFLPQASEGLAGQCFPTSGSTLGTRLWCITLPKAECVGSARQPASIIRGGTPCSNGIVGFRNLVALQLCQFWT